MGLTVLVIFNWLRNFVPIFVAGILVALFVWLPYKNSITEIGAVCFVAAGTVAGVIVAEKDRKEKIADARQQDADQSGNSDKKSL